jgi:hypothetical protein
MPDDQPTPLWTLRRDKRTTTCRVRLTSYGIDVAIVRDGSTVTTRTFETDTEALAWAAQNRAECEAEGWVSLLPRFGAIRRSRVPRA